MYREWSDGSGDAVGPDPIRVATSWSTQRLLTAALVMTIALATAGLAAATLVPPPTQAATPAPPGGVETPSSAGPETAIGDAVTVERNGRLRPAAVEHLTVVQVSVSTCGVRNVGSGVVVAEGLLLTAAHVVGDATLVRVDHQGVVVTGEVLGVLGDGRDVALVALDAPMRVPLPAGDPPAPGDAITLVGHPDGGPRTIVVGAAVAVDPGVAIQAGAGEILGVDVATRAGISGGAAVDADGEVVGLVVAREALSDTALVVRLPDLATIGDAALVPGQCRATA